MNTDDGIFLFFSSNGSGNMDLFVSELINGRFSPGARIDELSTDGDETWASVSWDRYLVHFGRTGGIYVSGRTKLKGRK